MNERWTWYYIDELIWQWESYQVSAAKSESFSRLVLLYLAYIWFYLSIIIIIIIINQYL